MSSVHVVAVWEWQCGALWLPHSPQVSRTLERAHGKRLTRVVLADAEPALRGHSVNLRTLTQAADEGGDECRVRRALYSVASAGARGLRWEWARLAAPPHPAELVYEPLPMEVQCRLEEAWSCGGESVVFDEWVVSLPRLTARAAGGCVRLLRRRVQPPYPLAKHTPAAPPPPARPQPAPPAATHTAPRSRIPHQHTGSSVHSVQSVKSAQSAHCPGSSAPAQCRAGARSASPRDRKPGLARQILHNLNIFSHNNKPNATCQVEVKQKPESVDEQRTDTECSSTRSGRRHSVDTVSTYLSHESKESLQRLRMPRGEAKHVSQRQPGGQGSSGGGCMHLLFQMASRCRDIHSSRGRDNKSSPGSNGMHLLTVQTSVGELLNCSGGSDDVFEAAPPAAAQATPGADGSIVSADEAAAAVCAWVRAAPCPQWGALCPACLRPLQRGAEPAVALTACQHLLHLHCLNAELERQRAAGRALSVACLVCGRTYGRRHRAAPPPPAAAQPPGDMTWTLRPAALPAWPHAATIYVTYSFQSGRQSGRHPAPGAPYYAVGFPRHSLLPDTPLGQQVLSALVAAWEAGVLFVVSASLTTGREHVVSWAVPAPPADGGPPAAPADADRVLRVHLARLHRLLAS